MSVGIGIAGGGAGLWELIAIANLFGKTRPYTDKNIIRATLSRVTAHPSKLHPILIKVARYRYYNQ